MILPEYISTFFLIPKKKIPELNSWPLEFFIITACNPYSSGDRSNDIKLNAKLKDDLTAASNFVEEIICTSKEGGHDAEPSFAVSYIGLKEALNFGRKYNQNAIFKIKNNKISAVSCTNDILEPAGNFLEKVVAEEDYNY